MEEDREILFSEQILQVPFCYSAGKVVSRFLLALCEECTLYGIRCPSCGKVYVPPRSTCGTCFVDVTDWVPLSGLGTLLTFTEINYAETVHPVEPPFIVGIIKLDGADTGLLHLIRSAKPDTLAVGMRLKAVFAQKRRGHILDISHFEPL